MNAMNRGSLRAIAISLSAMRDHIQTISENEANKELGGDRQPALEYKYDGTSTDLEEAAIFINQAIRILRQIAPDPTDYEDWPREVKVPDLPCSIHYGSFDSDWE